MFLNDRPRDTESKQDGISKLKANADIAMIISDVNMPIMDGLTMCEKINADAEIKKVPIVMLTTEGAAELIQRAKQAGAKGWLVKPFKPDQLISVVHKLTA